MSKDVSYEFDHYEDLLSEFDFHIEWHSYCYVLKHDKYILYLGDESEIIAWLEGFKDRASYLK